MSWWIVSLIVSNIVALMNNKAYKGTNIQHWKLYKNAHKCWEQSGWTSCRRWEQTFPDKWNGNWSVISSQWGNSWELILMAFEAVCSSGQTHFTSYQILLLSSRSWHRHWRFILGLRKSSLSVYLISADENQEFFGL